MDSPWQLQVPVGPSWPSGVGTDLGEMLLQAKHRAPSGRKEISGGRKGSMNLARDLASGIVRGISVNSLPLPVSQLLS